MGRDRGSINMAVGLFVFFGTLTAGALMFLLLNQAVEPMFSIADTSSYANNSSKLTMGMSRANALWDYWAFFVLALSAVLGLATAAWAGRRPN